MTKDNNSKPSNNQGSNNKPLNNSIPKQDGTSKINFTDRGGITTKGISNSKTTTTKRD